MTKLKISSFGIQWSKPNFDHSSMAKNRVVTFYFCKERKIQTLVKSFIVLNIQWPFKQKNTN
jgi:hypothetical protein